MSAILTTIGLVASLAGVVLLFLFGMPFRLRPRERNLIRTGTPDQDQARIEVKFSALGYLGLVLIVFATAFQTASVYWTPATGHEQRASESRSGSARLLGIFSGREPDFYLLGE